jgi:adenylate cyclase class 2
MIEVEAKVRINDIEGMEKRITEQGAEYKGTIKQADEYFDFPDMRIFNSGGAFRVRAADGSYRVTYKGVKKDEETTSREEIEIAIESAEKMIKILENMGLIRLCEIKKKRKVYLLAGLKISLDEVEGLGCFMEMEGMANSEAEYKEKKKEIFKLLDKLGVPAEDISQRSYMEMALGSRKI